jgi:thiamine-phosphate diphosphorylase
MRPPVPRIHAVTDAAIAGLAGLPTIAASLAVAPQVALHARAPGWDAGPLMTLGRVLLTTAARNRSVVLVNDRVDVARVLGAAGVHLPENGLPDDVARRLLGPGALIGRSTHSAAAAHAARDRGVDYIFLGPIWETRSHPHRAPLGPGEIERVSGVPVIAIGGITPDRARTCRDAGAWGVAAISALWRSPDPGSAAREFLLSFPGEPDPHYSERSGTSAQR